LRIIRCGLFLGLLLALLISACTVTKIQLPDYSEFVSERQKAVPVSVQEIYGRFTANTSGKTVRSTFNLLLQPGKNAYLEIQNPSGQLIYVVSLNPETITLLWAQDGSFLEEPANPKSLEEIIGFPVPPEDLLFIIGGFGLDFSKWEIAKSRSDGWDLSREDYVAQVSLKESVSRIAIMPQTRTPLLIRYEDYRMMNDRLIPGRMRFELSKKKISLELDIEKYLPRSEPVSSDLFKVQLPKGAHLLSLSDIYEGKPLLFNH
jgi:outer membrane biogenesis lipoprotein LolB